MPSGVIGGTGGLFGTGGGEAGGIALGPSISGGESADAGQATVTASATPHAVGAWAEVVTSSDGDAQGIAITLTGNSSTSAADTSTLLDVGIGAASSEVVLVESVPIGWRPLGTSIVIPCPIPHGSRVALRTRSIVASKAITVTAVLLQGTETTAPVTLGASTANSRGVVLPAATNATTPGSWQTIATTAQDFQAVIVEIQGGNDTTLIATGVRIDIGIGGTVIGSTFWQANGAEFIHPTAPTLIDVDIPSGSTVQARAYSNSAATFDVVLIAIPA